VVAALHRWWLCNSGGCSGVVCSKSGADLQLFTVSHWNKGYSLTSPEDAAAATSSDSPAFPPLKFQLLPPVTESVNKEQSPWLVPFKIDDMNNCN
jgi:hypothetical protein